MGNYTILYMFENPRKGRQARNFTTNAPKILDRKSSSEQIFSRKLPLGAPVAIPIKIVDDGKRKRWSPCLAFPSYPALSSHCPRKRRGKIDSTSFQTLSRLSQVSQLLRRREFMLELKRVDRARVQTEMVQFIAWSFASSSTVDSLLTDTSIRRTPL